MTSKATNKFSPEVRTRAVRLILDHEGEHASRCAAVSSIAAKIIRTAQTLHEWVKKAGATRRGRRRTTDASGHSMSLRSRAFNAAIRLLRRVFSTLMSGRSASTLPVDGLKTLKVSSPTGVPGDRHARSRQIGPGGQVADHRQA